MMEVYKTLPEGTLAELIDNILYMSPSPSYQHQKTLQKIFRAFSSEITDKKKGDVIVAPFDVYLDSNDNAVQPDIVAILNGNSGKLNKSGHFEGVPDLIIEILSPSNKELDQVKKKNLYEKFRVKEYWIVDPDTKLASGFQISNGKYEKIAEEIGTIRSKLLAIDFKF